MQRTVENFDMYIQFFLENKKSRTYRRVSFSDEKPCKLTFWESIDRHIDQYIYRFFTLGTITTIEQENK